MGLENVIRKLTPLLLASSLSFSNCGKGEECASDNDCPGEEICSNSRCTASAGACNDDYDCGENQICDNYSCISLTPSLPGVPATTKIIDDKAAGDMISVSPDKKILTFSSASEYAKNLKNGDVIVAGVYTNIPVGLLRKVTSKTETSSEIVVNTAQATLEDAVENGTFGGKITFTSEYVQRAALLVDGVRFGVKEAPLKIDYTNSQVLTLDFDGTELYNCKKSEKDNPNNKCYCNECKVVLDGSFEMGLESEIMIDISSFKLKYAKFALTGTESLDLTLSGEFAASIETDIPEVTVATFPPFPLPVTIAGFPVIVVPSLSVEFGLEAKGELSLESSVTQSLSATYGVEYKDKNWSDIKNFGYDFDFVPPTLTQSGATARAYVKPKLNFDLYAVSGPYVGAEASINGEVYPHQNPWCSLSAGLWIGVGFETEILGYNLVNYKNTLYEYEKELYTCESSTTCTTKCDYIEQKECTDETGWKECGDYNDDGCLEWSEKFLCNLDGTSKQYCSGGECITDSCAAGQWQCADGACISSAWHCDGGADCTGGEDEEGCGCLETNECVYAGAKGCFDNGWKECGDFNGDNCLEWGNYHACGAEEECSWGECVKYEGCPSSKFLCDNGTCILKAYLCDGKNDCEGGEDEVDKLCCIPDDYFKYVCEDSNLVMIDNCGNILSEKKCWQYQQKKCLEYEENGEKEAGCGYKICKGGDVYYSSSFDGDAGWQMLAQDCGNKTCKDGECTNCTTHAYKKCVMSSFDKMDSFWFDSCNNQEEIYDNCASYAYKKCQDGECVFDDNFCNPKYDYTLCIENAVYWADACGNVTGFAESCSQECEDGMCISLTCNVDADCGLDSICQKSTGECLPEPSPLCTGANCAQVGIYVYDNGSEADDSFGLEIKDAFYGETPSGGGKTWTVPMVDGQTYEMLLYGIGVPDGIGTYAIELTNAVKVDGPPLEGSDLDDGMSFVWHIKAKK